VDDYGRRLAVRQSGIYQQLCGAAEHRHRPHLRAQQPRSATIGRDFSLDFYALIVSCKTKKHREHPALGIELIIVRATPCPFQPKSCFISA
jgi:hypothetical protein